MKKSFFSKLFISFSVLFALTSCDNFFSGNLIQEELQGLIEEANAAEIEIFIAADADTGSVAPNGIVIHKVGKSFPVIFTEAKGYQFSHWEVIDRETKKPIENVIAIADSKETETRFTVINDAKNVYLHPVCIERPVVTTYSPQYSDTGVPRDTSITISFNKNISKSNDFSKIEITAGGVSVLDSYKKPVLNNNVLVFAADTNNLVSVTNTTKSLTVTVPRDLYYELGDQKITMGYDYSWTYNINNSSNDKAEITFNTSVASGKVTPSDTIKYNIGDTVSLKFEPNEGYSFSGWNIMDGDGNEIPDTVLKFADRNSISTSFTVMNKILAANITPKTNLLPTITSVSPNNAITGVPCDSEIEVSFNKSIQSKYINSKYIHIKDIYERDLTEYFKAPVPVLDVGSTTLCKSFAIAADYSKIDSLKDLVRRAGDLLDVKLVIDAEVQD